MENFLKQRLCQHKKKKGNAWAGNKKLIFSADFSAKNRFSVEMDRNIHGKN